jgi:hypothetical protein
MKIRVWNAYASNNSGSYTIVGRLPSDEVAAEVAAALAKLIDAHAAWRASPASEQPSRESPLAAFCRAEGLPWRDGQDGWDDWPQYSGDNRPRVAVVGRQVVVHHEYTVSLPPAFGAYFYEKGGRVEYEADHAHHPMVAICAFWWGWTTEAKATQGAELPGLIAALTGAAGPLTLAHGPFPPAWRTSGGKFGDAPFTLGAIFRDLVEGIDAVRTVADAHGATVHVRLFEALDREHDPLAYLRPNTPPTPGADD